MDKLIPIGAMVLFLVFYISLHQCCKAKTLRGTLINGAVALISGLAPFAAAMYFRP
jgi:hypothetical protein